MGEITVPTDVLSKMNETEAKVEGHHLTIRFPIWQLLALGAVGASVIFSVWLATHDLGMQLGSLKGTIINLTKVVEKNSEVARDIEKNVVGLEARHRNGDH